ncbi:MAG: hypothetical protein KME20_17855 [Kaiparowitsia implicata GSE-PSE-MK54-09C]|jgi:phenylpyruvate tautomerase PptA (4-oxalocrotonate tautomerase family)|nr:hypothetical protein [Kaiparowitsia implicata GSE-PSE-MK54-09C]
MPLISVQTSVAQPDADTVKHLLQALSTSLATHVGKPESYVMTAFNADVPMTFGGTFDPACYIEIKSVGSFQPSQTQAMTQAFCQMVSKTLGVPGDRTYIEFADAQGYLWGWNGRTFG